MVNYKKKYLKYKKKYLNIKQRGGGIGGAAGAEFYKKLTDKEDPSLSLEEQMSAALANMSLEDLSGLQKSFCATEGSLGDQVLEQMINYNIYKKYYEKIVNKNKGLRFNDSLYKIKEQIEDVDLVEAIHKILTDIIYEFSPLPKSGCHVREIIDVNVMEFIFNLGKVPLTPKRGRGRWGKHWDTLSTDNKLKVIAIASALIEKCNEDQDAGGGEGWSNWMP